MKQIDPPFTDPESTEMPSRLVSLERFIEWIDHNEALWRSQGLRPWIGKRTQGLSKNSVVVRLESDTLMSEIQLWDSGEWEVISGDYDGNSYELSPTSPARTTEELIDKVEAELRRVKVVL